MLTTPGEVCKQCCNGVHNHKGNVFEYSSILLEAVDVSQQGESTSPTRIDGPTHDSV
jgi:hypothetical protein